MRIDKIEAGEYKVEKNNVEYRVSKDSYTGGWSVYSEGKFLTYKKTKKECLDFIDIDNVKNLNIIDKTPTVKINNSFRVKGKDYKDHLWKVDDVIYSSKKNKWVIKGSYCNNSIDFGSNSWDYDDFELDCDVIEKE